MTINPPHKPGWLAELDLSFAAQNGRTTLARRSHHGPLLVQSCFYPEGPVCHTYVLHPPGGVAQGDRLNLRARTEYATETLITTPAAGKFYRCDTNESQQSNTIEIGANANFEWLPQENIFFPGSKVRLATRVELTSTSRFLGWEICCLGLPASGAPYTNGSLRLNFEIYRDGLPVFIERLGITADSPVTTEPWGLGGDPVFGTLVVTPADQSQLEAVRGLAETANTGATLREDVLIVRYLGHRGHEAKDFFLAAWSALRLGFNGRAACPPRVWAT